MSLIKTSKSFVVDKALQEMSKERTSTITINIPFELKKKLKTKALENETDMTYIINELIKNHLKTLDKK